MDLKALMSKMTPEQKLAHLTQVNVNCVFNESVPNVVTGPATELGLSADDVASIGTVLNFSGAAEMKKAQKRISMQTPIKYRCSL